MVRATLATDHARPRMRPELVAVDPAEVERSSARVHVGGRELTSRRTFVDEASGHVPYTDGAAVAVVVLLRLAVVLGMCIAATACSTADQPPRSAPPPTPTSSVAQQAAAPPPAPAPPAPSASSSTTRRTSTRPTTRPTPRPTTAQRVKPDCDISNSGAAYCEGGTAAENREAEQDASRDYREFCANAVSPKPETCQELGY